MSELSDISIDNPSVGGSPTNDTMMHGVTEKAATSSLFSERVKNKLGNFFPFTVGTGTGDEPHTNEEDKSRREIDDSGSQVSLRSSTLENKNSANTDNGCSERSASVRTRNKTTEGGQNREGS